MSTRNKKAFPEHPGYKFGILYRTRWGGVGINYYSSLKSLNQAIRRGVGSYHDIISRVVAVDGIYQPFETIGTQVIDLPKAQELLGRLEAIKASFPDL